MRLFCGIWLIKFERNSPTLAKKQKLQSQVITRGQTKAFTYRLNKYWFLRVVSSISKLNTTLWVGRGEDTWCMTWMLSHRKVKEAFLVCWDFLWPTKYFIQLPPLISCCTSYPKWAFENRNEWNTIRTICKHHQSFSWNCFQRYCASFCDGLSWSLSENLKHRPSWNAPALCNTSHPLNNSVF